MKNVLTHDLCDCQKYKNVSDKAKIELGDKMLFLSPFSF